MLAFWLRFGYAICNTMYAIKWHIYKYTYSVNKGKAMNDKELQKLSRKDLLEMLIEQSEELEATKAKLKIAVSELEDRDISIDKAGSIAEAALQLNGIFDAAELAAKQYLDNIKKLSERQERVCQRLEKESLEVANKRIAETKEKCAVLEAETKAKCTEIIAQSKIEAKKYWDEVSVKLEEFYEEHVGLKEMLENTSDILEQK